MIFGVWVVGRDVLAVILVAGRFSFSMGFVGYAIPVAIGGVWGTTAGFVGGVVDNLMMRFVDVLYALPFTVIVILLMVFFGRNFILLFVAIGAVEWLTMARIVPGQIISLNHQKFVEAPIPVGLSDARIMFRHLIPNVMTVIV